MAKVVIEVDGLNFRFHSDGRSVGRKVYVCDINGAHFTVEVWKATRGRRWKARGYAEHTSGHGGYSICRTQQHDAGTRIDVMTEVVQKLKHHIVDLRHAMGATLGEFAR